MKIKTFALTVVVAATLPVVAFAQQLPEPVYQAVLLALEDEYHAEAVYDATLEKFGDQRPFSNIIKAERVHQSALQKILDDNGLSYEQSSYLSGEKSVGELSGTLKEVCAVGVAAEIENARLYDEDLLPVVVDYPEITQVFVNLRDASIDKHLPAFERCAS